MPDLGDSEDAGVLHESRLVPGGRIGESLQTLGLITPEQLEEGLRIQQEKGGRLGWILMATGAVSRIDLYRGLAFHYGIPFRLVERDEFDELFERDLIEKVTADEAEEFHAVPVSRDGGRLVVFTALPGSPKTRAFYENRFGVSEVAETVVTDLDITRIIEHHYRSSILRRSIHGLFYRNEEESALKVFTQAQVAAFSALGLGLLGWLQVDAGSLMVALFAAVNLVFTINVASRFFVSLVGARCEKRGEIALEAIAALDDQELPVYSILIPAYREPAVIPSVIEAVRNLDYPANKLDVLLLLEEDDPETLEAARRARPPASWRFMVVPKTAPQTKPKACNYGVFFARGRYLTIYDAEDIPERDQLKKAIVAFRQSPGDHICFQAALNYFNWNENSITRMFSLEYSYWFDYLLPGLGRLGLPIPLGGTSNHFDIDRLRELGAWDPFNVTEDADLGIRASANGLRVGVIDSTTLEEANAHYGNWIRQRSRWIKGYMQTALVFNRHPIDLLRKLGWKRWSAFQVLVTATPLTFLATPVVSCVFLGWLLTQTRTFEPLFPPLVLYLGVGNLLIGNFIGVYLNILAVFRRRTYSLIPYAILNPLYWLCFHSIAAYRALWQLLRDPFYWEKTNHGITRVGVSG